VTGSTPASTIVIGVGNRDRGDDAAGPRVAERVANAGLGRSVTTMVVEGDLSDLALRWLPHQAVVIVDAAVTGARPGTVHRWPDLPPADQRPLSSHGVSLRDALELGRILGRTARTIDIVGIEGRSFELFEEPVTEVTRSIDLVADQLISELGHTEAAGTESGRSYVE
jgi:hydrogenase maturation protease